MHKFHYWDITKILNTGADILCAVGQRGNGKTFGVLKYFLQIYKKLKGRFVYIRRWADDVKGYNMEQLFTPLQKVIEILFGEGFTVEYYRRKYYLVNPSGVKVDIIGYVVSLSEVSHLKSIPFSNVVNLLWDEFIPMANERPMKDERLRYENTISTICRSRTDVKIFLLANTVSKFSWVFVYLGIDINKVEQGQIVTREVPLDDGEILKIALEYCEYNEEIGKRSSKYITSNMIKSGSWEIPPVDDIPSAPGEVVKDRLLFSVYIPDITPDKNSEDNVIIGCFLRHSKWVTIEENEDTFLFNHKVHHREFLVLKMINYKSHYYHLTTDKSLNYHVFNDMKYMLDDIEENTGISFISELYNGRIFSENLFVADYFNHAYTVYNRVTARQLL